MDIKNIFFIVINNNFNFPNNTLSNFTTTLDNPIHLGVGYEVGLTNIWYTVDYDINFANYIVETLEPKTETTLNSFCDKSSDKEAMQLETKKIAESIPIKTLSVKNSADNLTKIESEKLVEIAKHYKLYPIDLKNVRTMVKYLNEKWLKSLSELNNKFHDHLSKIDSQY